MNQELIFVTGVPGSKWSGFSQEFRDTWPDIDNSDCADPRKRYTHNDFSGHKGNYYGPNDLYGNWLDEEFGTREQWLWEIERSFTGDNPVKLVLSHNFAYYLEDLKTQFPESKVVMCYRPDRESYEWWHQAGGWEIHYPDYTWYIDNVTMQQEIMKQNKAMLAFAEANNVEFTRPDVDFFRTHFDRDIDFTFDKDVDVAVVG